MNNTLQGSSLLRQNKEMTKYLLQLARDRIYEVCVFGAGFVGTDFGWKLLQNYGICVDYYCDNNNELIGKEIQEGIYCKSIEELVKNREKTICFLMITIPNEMLVYEQLKKLNIKYIITYEDLLDLETTWIQFFPFMKKKQIAVYTCICGDYDDVSEPLEISGDCDYYLISDQEPKRKTVYQWIDINTVLPVGLTNDNILENRYCKMFPHKIFQEYKYSIYIDGNVVLKGNISECIPKLKDTRIGVTVQLFANSIYSEALRMMKSGRDKPENFIRQVKKYWYQGMPDDFGIFWCNVLIREHNNPICIKIMEEWWEEFTKYSHRDQISFPYVLWKNGFTAGDVMKLLDSRKPDFLFNNPYIIYNPGHKCKQLYTWRNDARKI